MGAINIPGIGTVPGYGEAGGPGYGAVITAAPISAKPAIATPQPVGPIYWGGNPIVEKPIVYQPPVTPATGAQTSGTPVPANYPMNQLFVNTDGSLWEYSSSTNSWFSAGTPYSGGGQAPAATAPATSTTLTTNPVPSGYPTSSTYTDASGNVWAYNGASWVNYGSGSNAASNAAAVAYANAQAASASGAGTTSAAPVTVTTTSATDSYQSILDWLSQETLISGVPNWALAAGVGLLALKLFQGKGKR